MDSSMVKIDNLMAYQGGPKAFQEAYTLLLSSSQETPFSLCLRFLFEVEPPHFIPKGIVWAFFQSGQDQPQVFRKEFDLEQHDILHADKFVEMGGCHLSLADCMGTLQTNGHHLKWELVFEDPVLSARPFPDIFYPFQKPSYKMAYPRFLNYARGQIFFDHKKFEFTRLKVCQSHAFGKAEPDFLYTQAVSFSEDSNAALALYVPRWAPSKAPFSQFPCVTLWHEDDWVNFHGYLAGRNFKLTDDGLSLDFSKNKARYHLRVTKKPKEDVSVLNESVHLNLMADLSLEIERKKSGFWQSSKILTSKAPVALLSKGFFTK